MIQRTALVVACTAALLVPFHVQAQEARSDERASLARTISYSRTGRSAAEIVSMAVAFDPSVAAAERKAAKLSRAADELERQRAAEILRRARLETTRTVLIAWSEAIGARRQLLTLQNLSTANDRIFAAVKALPPGRASDELIRELETEQARVRTAVVLAEAAFNTASSRLAALLNASVEAPVVVNTTFELPTLARIGADVEELIVRAAEGRPDLRVARVDEKLAEADFLLPFRESAVSTDSLLWKPRGDCDARHLDLSEARNRRRYVERLSRSEVESAFAHFVASQQARNELEPRLQTLRQKYGADELNASQLVMQQRQRLDLELEMERVTAALMRAGVDLIVALGMEP
ncbi:MAG TPA: hypothetical protein VJZ00_12995 [Thermoanaerobaculia bacterium]|nr:hypothetical protein [Thermoanaerobaculia bacterium]